MYGLRCAVLSVWKMISGMASGCPLNNLIPEWNDLLYTGNMVQAFNRLTKTNCFRSLREEFVPALCEAACTCNLNGKPVTTKANELSIIENAYESGYLAQIRQRHAQESALQL